MQYGPDPNAIYPNEAVKSVCYIKKRFDDELIDYLLKLQWWNWSAEKIFDNLEALYSGDLDRIKSII